MCNLYATMSDFIIYTTLLFIRMVFYSIFSLPTNAIYIYILDCVECQCFHLEINKIHTENVVLRQIKVENVNLNLIVLEISMFVCFVLSPFCVIIIYIISILMLKNLSFQ